MQPGIHRVAARVARSSAKCAALRASPRVRATARATVRVRVRARVTVTVRFRVRVRVAGASTVKLAPLCVIQRSATC